MTSRSSGGRAVAAAAIALALLFVLGLAACGGSTSTTGGSSAAATTGTAKSGGTLTLSYLTEPSSLDPAIAYNVIDWSVEHDVFQSFFRYTPKPGDAGTVLEPALATEVPSVANGGLSADGKTITIHLRPGVKFQPPVNRVVTAQDFKYTFERMMASPLSPGTGFYTNVVGAQAFMDKKAKTITGFKVVDPSTVEITLNQPDLSFLNALTMEFTDVLPKEWVAKWGKQVNRHPLGTGPFMFDHWTPGQEIVLKKNPNYWETGKPYLDELDYKLSYNPSTALLKLESGQVDALGDGVPPADLVRVKASPQWKPYVFQQQLIAISYVLMNVNMKPFDNLQVRQAVSWAINRDKVDQAARRAGGRPVAALPAGPARPRARQAVLRLRPRQGQGAARPGRLPERLQDDLLHRQRRPRSQDRPVDPGRPAGDRHQRLGQDRQQRHVLRAPGRARQGADRQLRLVDGLPGPGGLVRAAVQQERRGAGRDELQLLVVADRREDVRRSAGDHRPDGAPRQVRRAAVVHPQPGAVRHGLRADADDHVLHDHRRLLPAPGVPA